MSDDSVSMLMSLVSVGDAQAQRALWDRYFPELVRLARVRLAGTPRQVADEEDVALSVMQSYFRGAGRDRFPDLRGRDSLWRLLSRMTHRKVIDLVRYNSRQKRQQVGEWTSPGTNDPNDVLDQRPTPALELVLADECRRLLELLAPDLQQIALLKLEGYRNQEIADRQGCSVATVERRLKLIRDIWSDK